MSKTESALEQELERRLSILETEEATDPVHAMLSGRTIATFLAVAAAVVVVSWIGASL
ncbi:MAG: hypothetical protein ACTIJ6_11815 [Leucobacter sp.]